MSATVELMGETIPVVAQPWNRVTSGLAKWGDHFSSSTTDVTVAKLGLEAYDALCVLVPLLESRIPRYRWLGFESREAMESAPTGELGDGAGPTLPEIVQAFKTALSANGADSFKALGQLVDPRMLQALISGAIEDTVRKSSSTSRSQNGARKSTNGTTNGQRSESSSAAGRSLASGARSPDGA